MPGATATADDRSLDTELNPRVAAVRPSKTMLLTDLARSMRESGIDVIGLAAGEPDFDTPAAIMEAGQEALRCAARVLGCQALHALPFAVCPLTVLPISRVCWLPAAPRTSKISSQ